MRFVVASAFVSVLRLSVVSTCVSDEKDVNFSPWINYSSISLYLAVTVTGKWRPLMAGHTDDCLSISSAHAHVSRTVSQATTM